MTFDWLPYFLPNTPVIGNWIKVCARASFKIKSRFNKIYPQQGSKNAIFYYFHAILELTMFKELEFLALIILHLRFCLDI